MIIKFIWLRIVALNIVREIVLFVLICIDNIIYL